MAFLFIEIVDEFEITDKFRFFILDNVDSNDYYYYSSNLRAHGVRDYGTLC